MIYALFAALTLLILAVLLRPLLADKSALARKTALTLAVIIPASAGLLYAAGGNPSLPDAPYAERLQHDPSVILADTAAKMEHELAAKPTIAGFRRLSDFYVLRRDYPAALAAQRKAMALGADAAADWSALGGLLTALADGTVTQEARAAFAEALKRDPADLRARLFLGFAAEQAGRPKEAVAIWRDLESATRSDARFTAALHRRIEKTAKNAGFDAASVPPSPPQP